LLEFFENGSGMHSEEHKVVKVAEVVVVVEEGVAGIQDAETAGGTEYRRDKDGADGGAVFLSGVS
jgi:hypothetical protein